MIEHSGLCDLKRNRKISAKNAKHAKVSKNSLLFIRNVEFLEVAFRHITIHIPALGNVDKFIYSNANTRFVILNRRVALHECGTFDGRLWYEP